MVDFIFISSGPSFIPFSSLLGSESRKRKEIGWKEVGGCYEKGLHIVNVCFSLLQGLDFWATRSYCSLRVPSVTCTCYMVKRFASTRYAIS